MGMLWKKLTRANQMWLPLWIASPLLFLGIVYLVFFPLGLDWFGYGASVAIAAVTGAWIRSRYRVTVLERSDRGIVYWVRRVKKGEERKQETPPASVLTPHQ
jgi:hypothetical protein